jgi:hypothetical protein
MALKWSHLVSHYSIKHLDTVSYKMLALTEYRVVSWQQYHSIAAMISLDTLLGPISYRTQYPDAWCYSVILNETI